MKDFFEFIDESATAFQAVARIVADLTKAGARELKETSDWSGCLEQGGLYYVTRNDSSIISFAIPSKKPLGYHIFSAHSDSPCFKIKANPEMTVEDCYIMLNIEKYGGMLLSTWLDRPLSIAGRVMVLEQNKIVTKMVNLKDFTYIIPNLAIHMNRDANKGIEYNVQTDMRPLFGLQEQKKTVLNLVADYLQVEEDSIMGQDLYLYVKDSCCLLGTESNLMAGPRMDDLECVYGGATGLVNAYKSGISENSYIPVLAVFDNEEVGSGTKQGADSTFLTDVLERIEEGLGIKGDAKKCLLAESFMISADNAHAVHPNYTQKADPTNRPVLNGGVVIKYHGGQKYTTDAFSEAVFKQLCKAAGVCWQTYANRSDIAGGSTLGNIVTSHLSIPTVDVGLAQLAMHSAYETTGVKDLQDLQKIAEVFFKA